jgi:hypothetical protein
MGVSTKTAESTVINGINVDDLFALIDDIKREPEKGKTNWHVITNWQGQTRSRAEIKRYELGGQKGATPVLNRYRRAPRTRRFEQFRQSARSI